jgi:phosphopantothenoylcysteine decarboxylase / phosphopantothenate---cysteine ligase
VPHSSIVLGISGGIAAYKMPALIRLLQKNGASVKTVCTPAARSLVGLQTLRTLTGFPVYDDNAQPDSDMEHIALAQWGDYLLVCPATANTIAKIAHGIADNLLTSLALTFEHRLVIAPAMNTAMWNNRVTQDNIATLIQRGVHMLPVDEGELACGDSGSGRLLPIETIAEFMLSLSTRKYLAGKKVLIASGPTCEHIDDVRVITNLSSGKMGAALTHAAWLAGAQVTVVSGPASEPLPVGITIERVTTAQEMQNALVEKFPETDVCIMAAAISDFRPKSPVAGKMHRSDSGSLSLDLIANPDIAQILGTMKTRQVLVGFSLEAEEQDDTRALDKMHTKNCDMMIVNSAKASLSRDTTMIHILYPDKPAEYCPMESKTDAGKRIIERCAACMGILHE